MDEQQSTINRELTSGGFLFYHAKDAKMAEEEREKIAYLEARLDYSSPDKVLQVYEKAVQERIFMTPVGIFYLKNLQNFLLEQPEIDKNAISPIPLFHTYDRELREKQQPARNRLIVPAPKKKRRMIFPLSIILNVLLMIAIIAMFTITLESDNPNVLNYERALTDRYASWEQELTEREQDVRQRERELQIEEE